MHNIIQKTIQSLPKTKTPIHQWNKKIDSKLLAHASIGLYHKKEELLDTKCQISKHQQINFFVFWNY
jgi:hypothetical protein